MHGNYGSMSAKVPKASRKPTLREIAWAAGFLEGEGSFAQSSRSQHVCVSQVQRWPLEMLQEMFGGNISIRKVTSKSAFRQQPSFFWQITGTRARGVMMTLFAFMSPKRKEQIKAAMA